MDENKLTEVLNIEISQGVIVSAEEAVDWVKGTFLYRRILSNPLFYGFNGKGDDALHSFILEKCASSIDNLRKIRAVAVDEDETFSPDAGSHVMSRNFIDFETMKAIVKLPHDSGQHKLLTCLSNCAKIQEPIRRNEKKALNEAYKTIKYKLEGPQSKVRIQTDAEKCFVMLQAAIGQYFFSEFALRQQMSRMIDGASQVLSAVEQYAKEGSRHGQVAIQSMLLRRSLYTSLWGEHDGVLKKIGGVTQDMAAK
jgi:replicative superfamily II helicase